MTVFPQVSAGIKFSVSIAFPSVLGTWNVSVCLFFVVVVVCVCCVCVVYVCACVCVCVHVCVCACESVCVCVCACGWVGVLYKSTLHLSASYAQTASL